MAREVTWAESASDDLAEVASYIAKDSEFYAAAIIRELIEAARSLDMFAQRGRVVPEYRDHSIRELLVRDYRLVYEVGESVVHILRIIHGARPLPVIPPQPR
jgi:addiction module RelE/StbE family toxin